MRRPVCWLCLLLLAGIWLGDLTGIVPVRDVPCSREAAGLLKQKQAVIYGRIYQYYDSENSTGIHLKDVFSKSQFSENSLIPLEGTIVYMQEECDLPLGTWVCVQGRLQEIEAPRNPGEFDSRLYYRTRKIFYRMSGQKLSVYREDTWHLREGLSRIRKSLVNSLKKAAPGQAGILCAVAAGEKSLLGTEEKNLLAAGSILHVVSISGMHVSLLGMLIFYVLQRLGMRILPASAAASGVMIFYGMMTGESVSTMRALGMFGLAMTAKAVGRSYDLLSALALSAVLLLLDNPVYLYYSGFLLSCGCVCGAGVALPCLEKTMSFLKIKRKFLRNLMQAFLMGIAVQAAVLPMIVWFFYEIPMYGILVNLLVVPTLTVVLVSSLLGAGIGLWQLWAGKIILFPGCVLAEYYLYICRIVRKLPGAVLVVGQPEKWQVVLYYMILSAALYTGRRLALCREDAENKENASRPAGKKRGGQFSGAFVFLSLWAVAILLLCIRPGNCLEITCLDVGQGDGAVIRTAQRECYLVDGGSSSQQKVGQYRIVPFLKCKGISCVQAAFVSHTDEDHINGLAEIFQMIGTGQSALKIRYLVMPRLDEKDEGQQKLALLAEQAGTEVRYLQAGEQVKGKQICWKAISPLSGSQSGDINENSLVLVLQSGGFQGLFTGDMGEEQERRLEENLPDCDFLKVAHHGSRYSTGERFLRRVRPEIAVASASASNTYGHPHPDTLQRLEQNGCHVFLTKDSGAVTLEAEGQTVAVRTYLSQ